MNSQSEHDFQQELERRIRVYEQLEQADRWPGALGATDYLALALMTLILVVGAYQWGY